jgi:putative ATP-dependent endonuclease of OLD family
LQVAIIRRLVIQHFRGIESLVWLPAEGMNVILGGGDAGKTTILEAIALLFSPTNATVLTDADYFDRKTDGEFCIEAVMALPATSTIVTQPKPSWPWEWDGEKPVKPGEDEGAGAAANAVYRLRVRGTPDLDLEYEILQPNDTAAHLGVDVRREIGLVRLGGDDRGDRDLRLIRGSALERLLGDKTLRSRIAQRVAQADVHEELTDAAKGQLVELGEAFSANALPTDLHLGVTGGPGLSLNALIGLTAKQRETQLPLSSWGSGTRRLAALEIAAIHQGDEPVVVIDELERGLEPYRQRGLVARMRARPAQTFVTTHSATVLDAAIDATLWYLDARGQIGCLARGMVNRLRNPEAYFARVPIVVEGATEVGFVEALLRRHLKVDLVAHGIAAADGGGNDNAVEILDALSAAGLQVAGFADEEGRNPEKWKRVHDRLGALLFRWPKGCIEANIIPLVPDPQIEAFLTPPDGLQGDRLRTLAERLGLEAKELKVIRETAADFRCLLIEAATGKIPDEKRGLDPGTKKAWKKHAEKWFKSIEGGRELEQKVVDLGLWPSLQPVLEPFVDAVRSIAQLQEEAALSS